MDKNTFISMSIALCAVTSSISPLRGTLVKEIVVDACLTGISDATHRSAYASTIPEAMGEPLNISEVEAVNIAGALQTFVGEGDKGKSVKILCDNMAAVQVLQSGRGKNRAILDMDDTVTISSFYLGNNAREGRGRGLLVPD